MTSESSVLKWRFFRSGGFDQPSLEKGSHLLNLDQLDQKLWVALACPTTGLHFDQRTLDLIDSDNDGRIRAPEFIAAAKWVGKLVKNPDEILKEPDALPLASIDDSTDEGKALLASAKSILANLGKKEAASISAADTSDTEKIFAQTSLNGDGIVTESSTDDDSLKAVIANIVASVGGDADRSGKLGASQAKGNAFFGELAAFEAWTAKGASDAAILPLGESTAAASAAVAAVEAKVDDYFARCRLAAFDTRATAALNREEKEYLALAAKDLTISDQEIAGFPLARVEAARSLPLGEGVNPAWAAAIATLRSAALEPLAKTTDSLSEGDWAEVKTALSAYRSWMAAKAGASVEALGLDRVKELLASDAKAKLADLIAADLAEAGNASSIENVDRLVRYYCNLGQLAHNFVNFRDFYDPRRRAAFAVGTLYLDQRSCDLCLPVQDAGRHAALAGMAGTYLAYCDVARKGSGEKMQIVAAFTNGDSDNLMVGRNGIFYDRKGRDWDATITKIVDNPISIRQAFWSPYKKLVRMIDEQIAKRAAAADKASDGKLANAATAAADAKAPTAPPKKMDVGTVAAIGVAAGAIGTFLATLAGYAIGVVALGPLAILGLIVGVLAVISGPSMIIAFLKLRKRNLGPILDANGWAVNAAAKITVPFGAALTKVAALPSGSTREMRDPYAEKKSPWPKLIVLAIILYFAYGFLDGKGLIHKWTDGFIGAELAVPAFDPSKPYEIVPASPVSEAPPAAPVPAG